MEFAMTDPSTFPVAFTAAALERAIDVMAEAGPGNALRIFVVGGGCSGFNYGFKLDTEIAEDDLVETLDAHGHKVVIDPFSLPLIQGATIDFKDEMFERAFVVLNPNAKNTCGCGSSFSI